MSNHKIVFISRVVVILGTTRETPHTNIFNMAATVIDYISSNSGIF